MLELNSWQNPNSFTDSWSQFKEPAKWDFSPVALSTMTCSGVCVLRVQLWITASSSTRSPELAWFWYCFKNARATFPSDQSCKQSWIWKTNSPLKLYLMPPLLGWRQQRLPFLQWVQKPLPDHASKAHTSQSLYMAKKCIPRFSPSFEEVQHHVLPVQKFLW